MSALEICFRGFAVFWALIVLWLNFEAWFRAAKIVEGLRESSRWKSSIRWYRAAVLAMDIIGAVFIYWVFS